MNPRFTAIAVALAAIVLGVAQDVLPGKAFYHTWQYAALLAIAMLVIASYAWSARSGADGIAGKRTALAIVGALVVAGSALTAGLIGPDTQVVSGSPGTVVPIIDLRAAAFFGQADPATIARGDATVVLRAKDAPQIDIPAHGYRYLGTSIVYLETKPAAFISASDLRGNHLTVTQPTNTMFLSPVLLFPSTQPIKDKVFPLDTFALPALHRVARVLYFSADDAATFNHLGSRQPALVVSVNDDSGQTVGLTIVPSNREITVGGFRLTATLGAYPRVVVASAPHPAFIIGGIGLFLIGVIASFSTGRRLQTESAQTAPTA